MIFNRLLAIFLVNLSLISCGKRQVEIITTGTCSERVIFGAEKLGDCLSEEGYKVIFSTDKKTEPNQFSVIIGEAADPEFNSLVPGKVNELNTPDHKEGFSIRSAGKSIVISGYDGSGVLYGCIGLIHKIEEEGRLPGI
jgi:hypothetical protein